MIEVKNLHKSFEDIKILKGISTSFEKGKTNLIIGQSGSGKTVLLKCLLGLFDYQQGSIAYDQKLFSSLTANEKRILRSQIGMVFQGGALFDSMNVEENILFPLQMFSNENQSEMLDRVNFCLKRVNLENVNHLYPAELSGGMQKRVAIARAILMQPKALIMDEPFSGLDKDNIVNTQLLIKYAIETLNIPAVLVTHSLEHLDDMHCKEIIKI